MVAYTNYPTDARIRREAEALVERGDDVGILCPWVPELEGHTTLGGVAVHPVMSFSYSGGTRSVHYLARYVAFVFRAGVTLLRLHRQQPYDVIHVHSMPDFLIFSALGPKLLGARTVLDVHDLMPQLYASKFEVPESHWFIRLIRAVERWSIGFADRAVAVHRPHLEALVRHGNSARKFVVLMNLPDPRLFKPRKKTPTSPPFTVIYHGMVGSRHGLDVAVSAVAIARQEVPGLELRIIGDGDYFDRIRELVTEAGLQDCVRLEQGMVPIERLLPALDEASVGIVPILDDPFTRFMLPVKLLEYVALGVPVIASSTETIRSYFDDETLAFCPPGDVEQLAARIVDLYRYPERRAELAAAGRAFSAEHSWEAEKHKYYEMIDALVAQGKSSPPAPDPVGESI